MLTQLRVLGYVFNPVSFYWCYRGDGSLACMIAELNNTFGERLPELLHGPRSRTSTRSACTSRRSSGSTSSTSTRSRSRRTRSGRASTCARTATRPLTRRAPRPAPELTNALGRAGSSLRYPLMPRAGDRADPLAGAPPLAEARAVPPQAAVRPRRGLGARVSTHLVRADAPAAAACRRALACSSASRLRVLERALAHLEGGTLDVRLPGRGRAALRRRAAGARWRSTTRASSAGSRRAARSGSASRTRPASGQPTTSSRSSSSCSATPRRRGRAAPASCARLLEARPRLRRRNGLLGARRNIAYHYDLGNDLFEPDPRRDDDVLLRRLRAARTSRSPTRSARKLPARSATSSASGPTTTCSRSAAAGAASRCIAAGEYGAQRHRADDLGRAGRARARARSRAGLATGSRSCEQDYRLHEGRYTKIASIEMLEAIGERQFADVLRDHRPPARARRRRLHPDDPRPRRALERATARRPTGSSATSSRAA